MEKRMIRVRDLVLGDGTPKICVPVTAKDRGELLRQADTVRESPCDLVEWRADFYGETQEKAWAVQALGILRERLGGRPILFTFRTRGEGGEREIPMEEYEELNVRAAESGLADLCDIELNRGEERMRRMAERIHACGGRVVASFHDFSGTPEQEQIVRVLRRMQELGADVTKAAVMPRTEQDVLSLLEASLQMKTRYADRPFITMSMGRLGGISRLAGSLTGSAVTFATAGRASAPGQMEAELVARMLPVLQSEVR